MALKRRQAESSKDAAVCRHTSTSVYIGTVFVGVVADLCWQNEYASILAKRVNEEKAKKSELRSKSLLHLLVGLER